jgi:hypothetical protein
VSGAGAVGGSWYLNRRWPYYRSLPPSLKLLGVVIVVAPCLAIQAERRGLEYDKSQWFVSRIYVVIYKYFFFFDQDGRR